MIKFVFPSMPVQLGRHLAIAVLFCFSLPAGAATILGISQSFSVLGYSGVTNSHVDPNPHTHISGNVGVSPLPLTSITGFPPGLVTEGAILGPGSSADLALADINNAALYLAGLPMTSDLSNADLGGQTLTPGVYYLSDVTALLNGMLTLDAGGDPNARFVFQIANALSTGAGSVVQVINAGAGTEVYWVLGKEAILGAASSFAGNILAYSSVNLDAGAQILGRAFARTESVTLIDNFITNNVFAQDFGSYGFSGGAEEVPEPGTLAMLGMGLLAMGVVRRRTRNAARRE